MIRPALLAACFLAVPGLAQAQAAPAAPARAAAVSPRAMAIARLLIPLDVSTEAAMREGRKAYFKAAGSDPGLVELEREYPGLAAALWPVLEQEIRRAIVEEHPLYLDMVAAFLASRLEPVELDAMHAFYSGPAGERIIAEMYRGLNVDGMMAEMISTGGQSVSAATVQSTMSSESRRLSATLRPEDLSAVQALLRAIPPARLGPFNADLQRKMVEWINKPTPELDARIDRIVGAWMERYMREHPRRD
jgi:hypothetical protein